ncbi:MAG: hypothetical protein QM689_02700 [Oscillospiraceae bacterium]
MELVFVIVLICIILFYLVFGLKAKLYTEKKHILMFSLLAFILMTTINAISCEKKISLSNPTLDKIISKNITTEEHLLQLGFTKHDNYYIMHLDSDKSLCYIKVSLHDSSKKDMKFSNNYKNVKYEAHEDRAGIFSLKRLFTNDDDLYVRRWYTLVIDDVIIEISEDTTENTTPAFLSYFDNTQ